MGFYLQRPTTLLCPSMVRTQGASCNISHRMMMMMMMINIITIMHLIKFEAQVFTFKRHGFVDRYRIYPVILRILYWHGCLGACLCSSLVLID